MSDQIDVTSLEVRLKNVLEMYDFVEGEEFRG